MWHAAVNSRGMYLSAANPEILVSSLVEIMQNLVSRIGSGSSLSINGEELHTGTVMYQASYSTDGWWGDVKAHEVSPITGMVTTDTYLWSASEALGSGSDWDTVDWDSGRKIATFDPVSGNGLAFRWASLTTALQDQLNDNPLTGAVDSDGLGEDRLEYIRGSNAKEKKKFGGIFRDRYSKLGDIVHSAPFYVDYLKYEDTNGDGFDEEIPYGVLYTNANDGMMHAFHADDGHEVFAYVPNLVFDHLNMLPVAEPNFRHMYYLDLTPQIKEIGTVTGGVFNSEKLLVSGLGKGGKGYFCLDVTDPESNTEVNADTWVKWEYPQQGASAAEKDNMGYTFSEAFFVKSYADGHEWIVVFGNGYASTSGTAALYVVDARTGELLSMIDTGKIGNNGLSTPTPIDINGDLKVDYIYAGDLLGNVWKFDLTDTDPANWGSAYLDAISGTPEPLFTAKGRTKNPDGTYVDPPNIYEQAITTKVNVMRHCDITQNGYLVLFGTGKYLSTLDADNTQYQTIYGVWDYGQTTDEYLGSFNRGGSTQLSNQADTVTLLEQTIVQWNDANYGTWLRVLSDHEPTWATDILGNLTHNAGWYVDLPVAKERVIRNSFVRDGKLIMITSIPEDDPCAAGGDSIVHEMNACSGGRLASAQFDINGDGIIDENDLIQVQNPNWTPGSGLPEFLNVPPTGIKFDTMMYPPIILITPGGQTERKYFSTAAGNISTLEEQAERRGMFYWRVIER
jgi:type IV pilus assembly protein PilY1